MTTRVGASLPRFDPEEGTVILRPDGAGEGTWVGCPGVLHEPERGRFLLTYRRRRPRGDPATERGWRCAVAVSGDGVAFRDVWAVEKGELGTPSMERSCLLPDPAGGYLLYLSYVDPADQRWRIDVVHAREPDGFDVATAAPVLTAAATGTEGVKDPYALRIGPAIHLFASVAAAAGLEGEARMRAHATADIFATGVTTHPTALAIGMDGRRFQWRGIVLDVGTGWDGYQARLNSVVRMGGAWVGFYDGARGAEENYEEHCGLALSHDLERWTRLTPDGPWATSPHGTRSLRYVEAVPVGDELWLYYEYARADGAHELRLSRLGR